MVFSIWELFNVIIKYFLLTGPQTSTLSLDKYHHHHFTSTHRALNFHSLSPPLILGSPEWRQILSSNMLFVHIALRLNTKIIFIFSIWQLDLLTGIVCRHVPFRLPSHTAPFLACWPTSGLESKKFETDSHVLGWWVEQFCSI